MLPSLALHPLPVTPRVHPHSERGLNFTDSRRQLSSLRRAVPAWLSSTECLLPCPSAHSSLCTFAGLNTDSWGLFLPSLPQAAEAGSPEDHYVLLCLTQQLPSWISSSGLLGVSAIQIPDRLQLMPAVLQPSYNHKSFWVLILDYWCLV